MSGRLISKAKNLEDNGMADSNLSMWRKTEKGTTTLVTDACLKETALNSMYAVLIHQNRYREHRVTRFSFVNACINSMHPTYRKIMI